MTSIESAAVLAAAPPTGQAVTFWLLAIVSVAAALGMVFSRRAVYSAIMLAVVMLSLAVLYAAQEAPFLAFVQIIVYTGAVLMLFLFVLMLVGVDSSDSLVETIRGQRVAAGLAAMGFLSLLVFGLSQAALDSIATVGDPAGGSVPAIVSANQEAGGNIQSLATLIFTRHVFAFEVTSALLITAALGAMVLAHRERTTRKPTQRELSKRRIAGPHPTPLPAPGVYARHNAVDMPALLPDGSPAPLSVNPVIARQAERAGLPEVTVPEDAHDQPLDEPTYGGVARTGSAGSGSPEEGERGSA